MENDFASGRSRAMPHHDGRRFERIEQARGIREVGAERAHFEYQLGARTGFRFREGDQRRSGSGREPCEAQPGDFVDDGRLHAVEDHEFEAFGLEQSVAALQCFFLGAGSNPEQSLEVDANLGGRDRVESIREIDPARESTRREGRDEELLGEGRSPGRGRAADLAQSSAWKSASESDIERLDPRGAVQRSLRTLTLSRPSSRFVARLGGRSKKNSIGFSVKPPGVFKPKMISRRMTEMHANQGFVAPECNAGKMWPTYRRSSVPLDWASETPARRQVPRHTVGSLL